jgi:LmbE family N-acetylglucosaminyl deacetylase
MTERVLVVAPHPDDETLGCGGTLLRMADNGAQVAWLIVTDMSEGNGWSLTRVRERDAEIEKVTALFGFSDVFRMGLATCQLDAIPMSELVGKFSAVFNSFQPQQVFLPNRSDAHTDHRVTFDAGVACVKWFRYPSVRRVLTYETISETEFALDAQSPFQPNYYVDISEYLERKLAIMSVYASEMNAFPFPRSAEAIRSLATFRGSTAGFRAAEAFQLLRERY